MALATRPSPGQRSPQHKLGVLQSSRFLARDHRLHAKGFQTVYSHPSWSNQKLGAVTAAWYQREITVPDRWAGRRIYVSFDTLNSFAAVFLDGQQVGETIFPG